jgi:1,2-diacylglycerol 3-beta-glucosyltransferase
VIVSILVFTAGLPVLTVGGYLGALGCLARVAREDSFNSLEGTPVPFFTIVVPAHNEAAGIERTIRSLLSVDYPPESFSVLVVADNCTDDTAERAQLAGARVLIRNDEANRGKGFALKYAFETLIVESKSDGVVVVDADTDVSRNLLSAMARRLLDGEQAMQAHYGVRNAEETWRTRLMNVAFTLYHGVRSSARERLSLSTGLRGNGMGFAIDALRQVPYRAYSLVEDVEYGIELGLRSIRVAYVDNAAVFGEMVAGSSASESQRTRWEQGRHGMATRYAPILLSRAFRERNLMLLDLALDLLTPPLTSVVLFTATGCVVAAGTVIIGVAEPFVLLPWMVASLGLAAYLAGGIRLSSHGGQALRDLAHAPKYALWKLALRVRGRRSQDHAWIRTRRNGENS